jgi:hypothetical protein
MREMPLKPYQFILKNGYFGLVFASFLKKLSSFEFCVQTPPSQKVPKKAYFRQKM